MFILTGNRSRILTSDSGFVVESGLVAIVEGDECAVRALELVVDIRTKQRKGKSRS